MQTHSGVYRRPDPILPRSSVQETSIVFWQGQLLAISFDRGEGFPVQIVVHRVSDGALLATWPWTAGFGNPIIDGGNLYVIGSTQPSQYAPGNQVIICQLDPVTFQPGAATTLITAPGDYGYTIPNSGICKAPDGSYIIATDYFLTTNKTQGRIVWYKAPSLLGPYTRFGNVVSYAAFSDQLMIGAPKPFYVPGGAHPNRCYFLYTSSVNGQPGLPQLPVYQALGYTDDFNSFTACGPLVYPDAPAIDGVNSSDGCQPVDPGDGWVRLCYMAGDQQTWGSVNVGLFRGALADLVASFGA